MTLNISSRKVELLIGGQDWSDWIDPDNGIQVGYPEYEVGSGLLIAQGTINLTFGANYSLLPSSPYYRFNPSQWRRGQTVTIKVANASGTLTYLPCAGGGLRIIKAPQPPTKEIGGVQKMSIQIGCKLALEYFPPEPNKDVSGVVAGTNLDIAVIINNILNFIGLNSAFSNIGYFINYPLPKTGGNWLQMAGQLAASAGRYLRCDTYGNVTGYLIDMYIGTAIANYLIGRDEKIWEAIGDIAEQPIEKLILTGVKTTVEPVDTDPTEVIETAALAETYEFYNGLDGRSFNNTLGTLRITNTERLNAVNSVINPRVVIKVTIREALAKSYEFYNGLDGRSFNNTLGVLSIAETTYNLSNGIVSSTELIESEALAKSYEFYNGLDGRSFNNTLGFLRITTTLWVKVKDGLWNKTITIREALAKSYEFYNGLDGRSFNNTLGVLSTNTTPDTSGPTNIGGGEVSENTLKEEQIKAEVFAAQLASDGRERQRTIAVPFATTISQLVSYGDLYNKFLTGRALGWRFGGAITNAALTFQPFQTVTVTEDSNLYWLKLDALQYAISQTEAICFWHGIEVGTANVATPDDISKPVEVSFGNLLATDTSSSSSLNPTFSLIIASDISLTSATFATEPQQILATDTSAASSRFLFIFSAIATDTSSATSIAPVSPDTLAVIDSIEATGLTLTTTQKTIISNRINGLKSDGVWTKALAYYGFIGGTAAAHAINWKNPSAYLISWTGTLTHDAYGVKGDATTGYGDTGIVPSTDLSNSSLHLAAYQTITKTNLEAFEIGSSDDAVTNGTYLQNHNGILYFQNGLTDYVGTTTIGNTRAYLAGNILSETGKTFKDNTLIESSTFSISTANPLQSRSLFILNANLVSASNCKSDGGLGSVLISEGLTDGERDANYASEVAFQTALSRN